MLLVAGCGPVRATQVVGQDGSRDWWELECGHSEVACLQQASETCQGAWQAHEVRESAVRTESVSFSASADRGSLPNLPKDVHIGGKTLVVKCSGPVVPPRAAFGPECRMSPPRPNHCDVAQGDTFRTGRTYLPPGEAAPTLVAPSDEGLTPDAALAELRTIAEGLDADVDAVAQPIEAIDGIAKALRDFSRTYRVKPGMVKSLGKATLGGQTITVPADVRPEIADELKALLSRVKAADAALQGTPEKSAKLLAVIATRHARVKTLATAAAAPANATLNDPNATPKDKATAEARVAEIQELQLDARKKLDALRTKVTDLSAQIMQAIAKLGDAAS